MILDEIFEVILDRKKNPKENSYICSLFNKGEDKILEKIGEEATEVILASKKDKKSEIIHECADLIFHMLVLLGYKGIELREVYEELERRRK